MSAVGKILIFGGIALIVAGVFWELGGKNLPLGRLPGDIAIERPGFKFYFPLATSVLFSVLLTLVALAASYFRNKR